MKRLFLLLSILAIAACAQQEAPPPAPPAPPPPPPAPPPPPPQQSFNVYFNSGSSRLTPEAHQIVEAAAAHFKSGPPSPVQVTGYTDTAGSVALNQRLSQQRAQTVANALEAGGVPQTDVTVSGAGEAAAGESAAHSRRVELVEGGAATTPPPPPSPPPGAPPPGPGAPPPGS
jgi:OmpA-OmpF porin, OOP family